MRMPNFLEKDVPCLALELPDEVKKYRDEYDFESEIKAINKLLPTLDASSDMAKRLVFEKLIAEGLADGGHTLQGHAVKSVQGCFRGGGQGIVMSVHGFRPFVKVPVLLACKGGDQRGVGGSLVQKDLQNGL